MFPALKPYHNAQLFRIRSAHPPENTQKPPETTPDYSYALARFAAGNTAFLP